MSQTIRNIYDRQRAGALRATAEGITGNPLLRVNITFSSTPESARLFYRRDMINGFFGRIPFAYKARGERKGKIPRQGSYDEGFLAKLDEYILRLDSCKGRFVVKPLNKIADQLAEEMASLADLADDDMLFELSHRSIFSAWKKAATLWVMNDQTYTRSIGDYMIWFCYYDLWSKVRVFSDMFKGGEAQMEEAQKALEEKLFTVSSGGGAVEVTISGKKEITAVKIDPEVVDPEDVEMLQDLVMAAVNEAYRKVEKEAQSTFSGIAGGMGGLGNLGGLPF